MRIKQVLVTNLEQRVASVFKKAIAGDQAMFRLTTAPACAGHHRRVDNAQRPADGTWTTTIGQHMNSLRQRQTVTQQRAQSRLIFRRRSQHKRTNPQLQLGVVRHQDTHAVLFIDQLKAAGQLTQPRRHQSGKHRLLGHCVGGRTHRISRRFLYRES